MLRQGNLFFWVVFAPEGSAFTSRAKRGLVKKDPEGEKATQKKGLSDEAKFSRGIFIMDDGVYFLLFEP